MPNQQSGVDAPASQLLQSYLPQANQAPGAGKLEDNTQRQQNQLNFQLSDFESVERGSSVAQNTHSNALSSIDSQVQ